MENGDPIIDLRSAAEAVVAEEEDLASASVAPLHQIESLCMRCFKNGTTRLLLTRIPHFREIVLMAFECPHCNERNNEVQFAGELQPRGCCYSLEIPAGNSEMLNRQVVKSDSAIIKVPELDFEIPAESQRGRLSTVEGILVRAADELDSLQEERKKVDPVTAEAIDQFLIKLRSLVAGNVAFTFILDDPSGNSFIENPLAPSSDPFLSVRYYERTSEQQASLGFLVEPSLQEETERQVDSENHSNISQKEPHGSVGAISGQRAIAQGKTEEVAAALCRYSAPEEVDTLPSTCGACGASCVTRFYSTKIPYFREVVVMASTCDLCGYRSSELKAGGEIPERGKRITLSVQNFEDLSRDVIKSDMASVKVPELELELSSGTLGGMVTTVEGLITQISENLERVHGFSLGDSTDDWKRNKWQDFKSRLSMLLSLEKPWTLIVDDALSSSFVSFVTDSLEDDKQLSVEEYERTWEQNEELGLNDMDTSQADTAYRTEAAER
ncbi:zinc finger protein ZPR1-like [Zingiber officinale]|uniref:zinc finger protein ZPR1-like n=1 Tax=Zingiber officinale TaxID=94328 RepID=UPI001C4B0F40|nr:zinc finger protein ZPR1-like [Zingiber officinale]